MLRTSLTLTTATAALEIGRAVRSFERVETTASVEGESPQSACGVGVTREPVAVAQDELDLLLAVRRWIVETPEAVTVWHSAVHAPGDSVVPARQEEDTLEIWRRHLLSTALTQLTGRV